MPVVSCPACGNDITLPFPWKYPTYTCESCGHAFAGRRSMPLHLRQFHVPLTAATAAQVERIVPVVNAALGIRVNREQFFALAVAALVEKYGSAAPKSDESPDAVLSQLPVGDGSETATAERTTQEVA